MKVLIFGAYGWIGGQITDYLQNNNIDFEKAKSRADSYEDVEAEINRINPTHILSVIGRTHGIYEGEKINTIDYLEKPGKLKENINDNLYSPLVLAKLSEKYNIHFTYIGTGCIFEYDDVHPFGKEENGFTEENKPNFFGSSYSIVKGYTDMIMKMFPKVLNLRIRMPITNENNTRNFITKIITYQKVCSISNSMTVLPILIPVMINMMKSGKEGTYNFTNPGLISHNEILEMYKEIVDNNFEWKNFTIEEQNQILLGKRSNNFLETKKLEDFCKIMNIKDSVKWCLEKWKK
jgi:dTDP-4-dehydrorhamnose reductase